MVAAEILNREIQYAKSNDDLARHITCLPSLAVVFVFRMFLCVRRSVAAIVIIIARNFDV